MLPLEPRALLHGGPGPDPLDAIPIAGGLTNVLPSAMLQPLGSLPQLSSHPSAAVKIYLDFVGTNTVTGWGSYNVPAAPAYDTDGDSSTFSDTEISQVREIYARVAEKYSPFNVNVTTVDPGSYPFNQVVRVVIGGDGSWSGGIYGGYGYVNGFIGATSNTAWIFPKNLGKGLPKYVAEAAAHEAGHNFGLYHQSIYDGNGNKVDEYRGGRDKLSPDGTAPIMGFSYYADRGVWANGPSSNGAFANQNDLSIIAGNFFGYRPDDHGNDRLGAELLDVAGGLDASGYGVIEAIADVDCFKFHSGGGLIQLSADVAPFGAMLDLKLNLTDADGNSLASADTANLGESVTAFVPEGEYYLEVASHGNYGDIGQYSISGTVVPEPGAVGVLLLGFGWLAQRRNHRNRPNYDSRFRL
jgi:hypothetical protein